MNRRTTFLLRAIPFGYSAGGFGRSLAKACLSHGLEVLGFIQTHPQTSVLDGLPVFSWNEISGCDRSIPL